MNPSKLPTQQVRLRTYQTQALDDLRTKFGTMDRVVLASAPNSGKTVMALEFIKEEMIKGPKKILILSHGTVVLYNQWSEAFTAAGMAHAASFDQGSVVLTIPQRIRGDEGELEINEQIDLLIVDEAHEFYLADKVQQIIETTKPKKQLLLTGTPSKFIKSNVSEKDGYGLVIIPGIEIMDHSADLTVTCVTTNENILEADYTGDDDLKSNFKFKDTKGALDNLLKQMLETLEKSFTKQPGSTLRRVMRPLDVFGKLDKTMIACRNIAQAKQVQKYFVARGVATVRSTSDDDTDSTQMEAFKTDPAIKVLIVVGRGILGFNMPEMVNLVDMTCSRNIDRIYQLYARVMRKHPDGKKKFFYRVVPIQEAEISKFYTEAALCMMSKNFISRFNGRNLNEMQIPAAIRAKREPSGTVAEPASPGSRRTAEVDMDMFEAVLSVQLLDRIMSNGDLPFNEYAMASFGEIRTRLLGVNLPHSYWTKERRHQEALKYKTRAAFHKGSAGAYQAALRTGCLEDICGHMSSPYETHGHWNIKENCEKEASKYDTMSAFKKGSPGAYASSRKNGWTEAICDHFASLQKNHGHWDIKENCEKEASKYDTKTTFCKGSGGAYNAAARNGWLEEFFPYVPGQRHTRGHWNVKENCNEEALKYESKSLFKTNSPGAYDSARKNGWLDEFFPKKPTK